MASLAFALAHRGRDAGSDRLEPTMKMLRLGAVLMVATATTFACSDDDSAPDGGAGAAGDATNGQGGAGSDGGKAGSSNTGGKAGSGALAGAGGESTSNAGVWGRGGEGGDTNEAGRGGGGNEAGQGGQGAAGDASKAGQGGQGGESNVEACVNPWDSAEGGAGGEGGGEGAPFELAGEYVDNFDSDQSISSRMWNDMGIAAYDNEANVVYTQAPCDDQWSPSKFFKIVYTEPSGGSFYFCMIDYSLDTLAEAMASTKVADASNPDQSGCGSFPWSKALPQ
jgi:hypothetical protein